MLFCSTPTESSYTPETLTINIKLLRSLSLNDYLILSPQQTILISVL